MSNSKLDDFIEAMRARDPEFADYPIGVEEDPDSGGWIVIDGDTWRPIAVRYYRPAAEAIARKANGMNPKPGDEYLLAQEPHGKEFGPNYREPTCVVL